MMAEACFDGGVTEETMEEEEEGGRMQSSKQAPRTEMWGTTGS